ncbi:MAG TPA: TldD/PmbA family protein [Thermodesulfobacteriota bacterium]|nr:TldD/PmbA family protein [Thermodesulfobacteriota bacterium]
MIKKESAFRVLKKLVQESPADQTEAILLTEDSSLTRFAGSAVHQHVAERNGTIVLRVALGKRIAVVTTNRFQPSSVKQSLAKAISLARVQQPNDEFVTLPGPGSIPKIETFSKNISRLTPRQKVRTVQDLLRRVEEKGCKASGAFSNGEVELAVVNSLGVEAYQEFSDLFLHLIVENEKSSSYASFVSRNPDQLDIHSLAQEAIRKISQGEPIQVEPGEYEVILEPYAVNELLSFLGYLGFHALAVQEGRSFFSNRFGEKMVNEKVTIYDDGLDPEGLQVPFDFEGVPKKKVTFFERGVAKEVTYDSFTAGREGKNSTGHGLIAPNTSGPIPINLFMKGGGSSLEEMIRSVRRGIYVTRFHYTNVVEPMKAVITGMTRDGTFLIEEGEMTRPVKNLRFTDSILKALSRVSAISKERKICSEGTVYSRRFVTGTVVPAIKIDGFNFSGVSAL